MIELKGVSMLFPLIKPVEALSYSLENAIYTHAGLDEGKLLGGPRGRLLMHLAVFLHILVLPSVMVDSSVP